MNATEAVEYILAPVPAPAFLADTLERRPLHVRRAIRGYFSRWLTVERFTEVLTSVDPELLRLKSVKDDVTTAPVSLQRALDAFRGGATIVVNHLHLVHPPVAELCRLLEVYFHHPFQANIYFTPEGNQGFGAHFDLHDVFVLQIQGRKRWKVYAPAIELPLEEQFRAVRLAPDAAPVLDVVMEPGDLLYMPRGYIHEAANVGRELSLHMSLGMLSLTWRDALVMAVYDAAARHAELRRTVPLGDHVPRAHEALERALALVTEEMRGRTLQAAEERFALNRPAILPKFSNGAHVGADTPVVRDPLVICHLSRKTDHLDLTFQGKGLDFPLEAAEPLEFLLARDGPCTAREIPGPLDEANRLRLVRYLHEEGFLKLA